MDIYRSLASALDRTSWPTMSLFQAWWTVDSGKWSEMEDGGKQTWKRVRGRE